MQLYSVTSSPSVEIVAELANFLCESEKNKLILSFLGRILTLFLSEKLWQDAYVSKSDKFSFENNTLDVSVLAAKVKSHCFDGVRSARYRSWTQE